MASLSSDSHDFAGEADRSQSATASSNEPAPETLTIGAKMPDGTIYAGISPDTNKPMYTTPADAPSLMSFDQAKEYAAQLDAHGHQDWRVPTREELNALFINRFAIGGFNTNGGRPAGWYWSSTQDDWWSAWDQRFLDGIVCDLYKNPHSSVRCVR